MFEIKVEETKFRERRVEISMQKLEKLYWKGRRESILIDIRHNRQIQYIIK